MILNILDLDLSGILYGLINLIFNLLKLILIPLDNIIYAFLPSLSQAFTGVSNLFNYINQYISWAISLTGLSTQAITLIIAYYTFKLTVPIFFYLIKLVLSWWNRLKW